MLARLALLALLVPIVPSASPWTPAPIQGPPAADGPVDPGSARAWALLASSVLFERNGERHDLLAGAERSADLSTRAAQLLKDSWDIEKPEHLTQQLEWLRHVGHRSIWEKHFRDYGRLPEKEVDARCERIAEEEDRILWKTLWRNASRAAKIKGGLLAWDYSRYIALCRWSYAAGFLTQEEAWKRMDPIVRELQKAYTSWEELGQAYVIGYDCWRPGEGEATEAAFERLKNGEQSPWKTTAWKLKLAPLDKPEKKK